ncbi:TolC family protein [Puia sp. P3]|uniref:TolC family protein n=1 Tax=Puia sp. P3 TaxID=3423952 RepID=UPI003D675690
MTRFVLIAASLLTSQVLQAQQHPLSIKEVLTLAESGQPRLHAYKEQAAAVKDNADLARNTLVPSLTGGYRAGYATDNNITGMSYPGLLMPISGPVAAHSSNTMIPGTALAAYLQWTPITFGQRSAAVEKAAAQFKLSASAYDNALFQQRYTAILTYISIVYLQRLLNTQQANIDRTNTGLRQSLVLAKQGLRPGLDTVQFQSLLAQATMERLNTQRLYTAQVLELCRLTGLPNRPEDLRLTDTTLALQLPGQPDTTGTYAQNPTYQYYRAQVALSAANLKEIQRGWRPHLDLWANAYSRGSGIDAGGNIDKSRRLATLPHQSRRRPPAEHPHPPVHKSQHPKKTIPQPPPSRQRPARPVDLDLKRQVETAESNYRQNLLVAAEAPIQSKAARLYLAGPRTQL